jgi:hypothetical protein
MCGYKNIQYHSANAFVKKETDSFSEFEFLLLSLVQLSERVKLARLFAPRGLALKTRKLLSRNPLRKEWSRTAPSKTAIVAVQITNRKFLVRLLTNRN